MALRPPKERMTEMLDRIADQLPFDLSATSAAIIGAMLLGWVALVYLVMAFGVRNGELVWSGRHIGRLPAEQRWWSLFYGLGLIASGYVLLESTGAIDVALIPDRWLGSADFAVMCFLGFATLFGLLGGSTWERMLFVPITLLGAGMAAWLTFG
jgi:hypothetical protein